jgi:hypothetical protein
MRHVEKILDDAKAEVLTEMAPQTMTRRSVSSASGIDGRLAGGIPSVVQRYP